MKLRLGNPDTRLNEKYNGGDDLCHHLAKWTKAWGNRTATRVSTHISPYFGYNFHQLVSGNGAFPWHRRMGCVEGMVLIDI